MDKQLAAMSLEGKKEEKKEVKVEYGNKPLAAKRPRNTDGTPVVIETNLRRISKRISAPRV